MPTLTQEIKDFVNKQRMGFVATIGPANKPNLSPKGTTIAWDDNHLAFTGIRSDQTISNLKANPNLEINVVDPIRRRGYRFQGTAKILSDGEEFEKILSHYRTLGVKSEVKAIVLIGIDVAKEIKSPLYDLGLTEQEIVSEWKKRYLPD
ncbi:MAG: pyridoxamine 5'-phosphate oxidase family protein [Thaumarchaeota archaeon]|nr:pyridoxamine 5'-phosphate oxidase family protein [Nitrososphaerota archaeon]